MAAKIMPDIKGTLLQLHAKLFSMGFTEKNGKFSHPKYWCKIQPSAAVKGRYILSIGVSTDNIPDKPRDPMGW